MMRLRFQIANLTGFGSWADYAAADKMIMTGGNVGKFIQDFDAAARPVAQREYSALLAEERKVDPSSNEVPFYNWWYLGEQISRSQYKFDSSEIRPYLPFNQVKQGILDTAARLFHVSFQQELGSPAWAPSVETWDVVENGKPIGRFYLDMHPRPGKYSHDQMSPLLDGIVGKQLPEAALVCNFPQPTASDPGLMDYDDVVTFFHEFGHLMHHILGGNQQWAGISGITMEADFIETPSQMLEEWMHSPEVLSSFAHHYKTGDPVPADLVTRMNRASAFGRGVSVSFQNALSAISYDIYRSKPENIDLESLVLGDVHRYTPFATIPQQAYFYAGFNHLAGYASSYYTYMWDKVIAEDFFQQFNQRNPMLGDTPMRYRRQVLEPGGSVSANTLVRNFLGRPQNTDAFQQWLKDEFVTPPAP